MALIASIGLFIAMEELFHLIFGPYGLTHTHAPLQQLIQFSGMTLGAVDLAIVVGSVSILGNLAWLAQKTRLGIAWRATVDDPQMAGSFGISVLKVRYLNFFIGSALAGSRFHRLDRCLPWIEIIGRLKPARSIRRVPWPGNTSISTLAKFGVKALVLCAK